MEFPLAIQLRVRRSWARLVVLAALCALALPAGAAVTVQSRDTGWQFRLAPGPAS